MPRKTMMVLLLALAWMPGEPAARAESDAATIPPGAYECQVSRGYRFRPCTVSPGDGGDSVLEVPAGGLLAFTGTLHRRDAWILVEGRLTEPRPFGCFSCQEQCSVEPASCVCEEIAPAKSAECLRQPIHVLLKPAGKGKWVGVMAYRLHTLDETWVFDVTIRKPKR